MRQDTQIMGRESNKQNVQGSRMQQEKRKMGCNSSTTSKKFRQDSSSRGGNPEFTEKKEQDIGLGPSFERQTKVQKLLSTSELAASNMIQLKDPKINCTELSHSKRKVADLESKGPGQSASELVAKRALLFKERGRSYLAQKGPRTHQDPNRVNLKQEDQMTASQMKPTIGSLKYPGKSEIADDGSEPKHFSTSEVAARSGKIKSTSQHLSTSEVASVNTGQPSVHLSTSEVAAKKRRDEKRLKLHSKEIQPVQHLSTSEVVANHRSIAPGPSKNPQRSTSEVPAQQHDKEAVRQRMKKRHLQNRNRELKHREADEERRQEEERERERRRIERRAEEMRREEERLEERLREKKREERMIEERIRDKKRVEEKRIEEEIIAQRIREKKREEKMIEERIREKRREERKAAARLIEPRSTSEVAAKVALSSATALVDMVSEEEEEDIVVEKVEQAAPSQMFPVLEPHRKRHQSHTQREISPPKFYNKLDSDSESENEVGDDEEGDEVVALREDLSNPPKRSTSEMFVENLKKLKTSQKQWFEAPHKKTSDNLFEKLLERNKKLEKKKDVDGSKKVKDRVDEFLESCQRILPDADFPAVFKKISKYMSSISKVSPR